MLRIAHLAQDKCVDQSALAVCSSPPPTISTDRRQRARVILTMTAQTLARRTHRPRVGAPSLSLVYASAVK